MSLPILGELEPVGALPGQLIPYVCSPDRRYVAARQGARTVSVVDVCDDSLPELARFTAAPSGDLALHPSGQRLAQRYWGDLHLCGPPTEILARKRHDLRYLTWNAEPVDRRTTPAWAYAPESLSFSPDGRWLWFGSHTDQGAVILLLDAETLEIVDAHHPGPPCWGEGWRVNDEHAQGRQVYLVNAGDSLGGAYAVSEREGRIAPQEGVQEAVEAVGTYYIRDLRFLPGGQSMLMIERDLLLAELPWPPGPPLRTRYPTQGVFPTSLDIELPWYAPQDGWLEVVDSVTVTPERLLLNIDHRPHGDRTVALLSLRADTWEVEGLVPRPKSRLEFRQLYHLGRERFVGVGRSRSQVFKLVT
ncbi:MAG: hypothetical protein H6741_07330 [Alphaproteobacteria bacterium]|nr:hypothetical protein [Alphaproteobacteria bacterium]